MKKISLAFIIFILCGSYIFAQSDAAVLNVLAKKNPQVKWNAKSRIKGDFDYDGVTDYALRGRKGKLFVLGIVKGLPNAKSKSWTLEFGEDAGDQGGLCSVSKAIINTEDIDKDYAEFAKEYLDEKYAKMFAGLRKGSKGINIADGMCDSFHVFWDKKTREFTWWRI